MRKMFRLKRGVNLCYSKQGYIHFVSMRFAAMAEDKQKTIIDLCAQVGGEYCRALFEYMTTEVTAEEVTTQHNISKALLYDMMRKYYKAFPDWV